MKKTLLLALSLTLVSALSFPVSGQQETLVEVEALPCLAVDENGVVQAQVTNNVADGEVRLFFRRLHEEVEDFYWTRMESRGGGAYWSIFPQPVAEELERRELQELVEEVRFRWAGWWREKEEQTDRDPNDDLDTRTIEERAALGRLQSRDWMARLDDEGLEDWLDGLDYEPAEYYAAVYDGYGNLIAKSGLEVVQVRRDCPTNLTPQEAGLAENLTIGETAAWQRGEDVFHWACQGIVSRIDPNGVWRGDEVCRACVIAWWKRAPFLIPIASVATIGTGVILLDEDEPASPFQP